MDIDLQPKLINDVLSAMLKRKTRPHNWGMTEMTQLIKIYELSGGARKNMDDAYTKIELITGTKKRAAQKYLTFLRKPVDNPTPEDTLLLEFFALKETENKRERDQSLQSITESVKRQRSRNIPGDKTNYDRAIQQEVSHQSKIRRKDINRDARNDPLRYVPFHSLLCNPDLPHRRLDYAHNKTKIGVTDPQSTGPLPHNAAVDLYTNMAWIPDAWRFTIPISRINTDHVGAKCDYPYDLLDVTRDTTIQKLTDDIHKWFRYTNPDLNESFEVDLATLPSVDDSVNPTRLSSDHQADSLDLAADIPPSSSVEYIERIPTIIPKHRTAQTSDLFNIMRHIHIIISLSGRGNGGRQNLNRALNRASQGAANQGDDYAPPHLETVNNLIKDIATHKPSKETNLVDTIDWKRLSTHLETVNEYPCCVCFNCGMTMYPSKVQKYVCPKIRNKNDCRAWRVFEYFN